MSDSQLQDIKDRLDIVDVLSGYIRLNKAGRNFKAACPFHNEKTPSFVVSPDRQIWHCFGCGEGGDIFTFVMKIEGMDFPEAMRHLAEKAGVELKKANYEDRSAKARVLEANRIAKNFFREQLIKTKPGIEAKKYLTGRGLTEESINDFEIGYSPDAWHDTENFLLTRGFTRKEILAAGLIVERGGGAQSFAEGSNYYDRFRGRIMFPISDISGRTVGFGGRTFAHKDGQEAKYINSPESIVYSKSRVLYGMNFARERIRKTNNCILVEGYMDVIGSHQMGVVNAVASSGTALTLEQLKLIKRYALRLILSFDGDSAGQEAIRRSIDLAIGAGFNVKAVILPAEKDPSDFVSKPKEWKDLIVKAIDINDFYLKNAFGRYDVDTLEGKKKIANDLLEKIVKITSSIERSHWIKILADRTNIDEKILMEEMRRIQPPEIKKGVIVNTAGNADFLVKDIGDLEGYLLALLVTLPEAQKNIQKLKEYDFSFKNTTYRKIYDIISAQSDEYLRKANLMLDLKKKLDSDIFLRVSELALKVEYYYKIDEEPEKAIEVFRELLGRLVSSGYETKLKILEKDIKTAEDNNDSESVKILIKEMEDLLQKKKEL